MPFPSNIELLIAAGCTFLRSETCQACREPVEVFTTPGKREIALNPMCELLRPAVRHYETCSPLPTSKPEPPAPRVAMFGVNDPNHQLLAVGLADGVLVCQWAKGKGQHTGVPEDKFLSLKRVPYAYSYYTKTIKGKFPYTKLE